MRTSVRAVAFALVLGWGFSPSADAGDAVCCTNFLSSPGNPLSCDNLETYLTRKDLLQFCKNVRDAKPGVCPAKDKNCHDNCADLKSKLNAAIRDEEKARKASNDYSDSYHERKNTLVEDMNRRRNNISTFDRSVRDDEARIERLERIDEQLQDSPETRVIWRDPVSNQVYGFTKENLTDLRTLIGNLHGQIEQRKAQISRWEDELKQRGEVDLSNLADDEANGEGKTLRETLARLIEERKSAQSAYDNCSPQN